MELFVVEFMNHPTGGGAILTAPVYVENQEDAIGAAEQDLGVSAKHHNLHPVVKPFTEWAATI